MTRTYRVRLGLVAVGAVLGLLLTMQPAQSQGIGGRPRPPGLPGGPPPGYPGAPTPPGYPGPGMPGGPGIGRPPGIPGPGMPGGPGIGRPPGMPEFPRPPGIPRPEFPGMPESPRPPGMPEMPQPPFGPGPGPGIGGRPGFPEFPGGPPIYEWSCSNCGRILGTGPTPPTMPTCPGCGARFNGNRIDPGGPRLPGGFQPPATPGPDEIGIPGGEPPRMNFNSGVYVPPSDSPADKNASRMGRSVTIIAITMGVLLLVGIAIAAVVMALSSKKPARRPSRARSRRRYDDDY
jgi:hypothetical protein